MADSLIQQFDEIATQYGLPEDRGHGTFMWPGVDVPGRRMQSRLLRDYNKFASLVAGLLGGSDTLRDVANERSERHNVATAAIHRDSMPVGGKEAFELVHAAFRRPVALADHLHGDHEDLILVPDTNALYWNPALEEWRAPCAERFLIAITPTVINELDGHKEVYRDSTRRTKARRLIRQIGEYRARGILIDGVPLVRGISRIFTLAAEPDAQRLLPWMPMSADDIFLASALDVIRRNPRAPAVILTRDENLRNKIELVGLTSWLPKVVVAEYKGASGQ
jgi:hypothetical protein